MFRVSLFDHDRATSSRDILLTHPVDIHAHCMNLLNELPGDDGSHSIYIVRTFGDTVAQVTQTPNPKLYASRWRLDDIYENGHCNEFITYDHNQLSEWLMNVAWLFLRTAGAVHSTGATISTPRPL